MEPEIIEKMRQKAEEAYQQAYVPYSNFPVGAAVLTADGQIYSGCNIENVSYGLTNCAERTAIFKAVADGKRRLKAVMVLTDTGKPVSPCGACRQVIGEFGEEIEIIMTTFSNNTVHSTIEEMLPGAFSRGDMHDDL